MKANIRLLSIAGVATLAGALSACSTPVDLYGQEGAYPPVTPTASTYPTPYPGTATGTVAQQAPVAAVEYGRVTNVSLVSGTPTAAAPNQGRNLAGTAIGAIVGGLLGNQIGGGSGRTAATVLGAVGGGIAGNRIAQNTAPGATTATNPVYRVEVQTDQGYIRTYDVSTTGDLRVGDRVRIENGVIYLA